MNITLNSFMLWLHLLAMVGAIGGLVFAHAIQTSGDAAPLNKAVRLFNLFVLIGLITGLYLYAQKIMAAKAAAIDLGAVHMTVGIKMLLLLAAGALVGISAKAAREGHAGKASSLRLAGILVLAVAAFLGVTIPHV